MLGDKRHHERRRAHYGKIGDAADYRLIRDNLYVARYVGWERPTTYECGEGYAHPVGSACTGQCVLRG